LHLMEGVHGGWLHKRGGGTSWFGSTEWRRRWFVLRIDRPATTRALEYFENETASQPLGSIRLCDIVSVGQLESWEEGEAGCSSSPTYFFVKLKPRTYGLRGETEEDAKQWVAKIQEQVDRAKKDAKCSITKEEWLQMGKSEEEFRNLDLDGNGVLEGNEIPWYRRALMQVIPYTEQGKHKAAQNKSIFRSVVSQNLHRFRGAGFDLNLVYVTPRIIVMGFPSTGMEAAYRNPLEEVKKFFKIFHPDHYKVFNLCPPDERNYPKGSFVNYDGFAFEDHMPPMLSQIPEFTLNASSFLAEHPENVVAIHCKAGKGRSGCMAACLLLKEGLSGTPEEAIDHFDTKRAADKRGVTIPSQRRYVYYYDRVLHTGCMPQLQEFNLTEVILEGHNILHPFFELSMHMDGFSTSWNSRTTMSNEYSREELNTGSKSRWKCEDIKVGGDIRIDFYQAPRDFFDGDRYLFRLWLHLNYLPPDGHIAPLLRI